MCCVETLPRLVVGSRRRVVEEEGVVVVAAVVGAARGQLTVDRVVRSFIVGIDSALSKFRLMKLYLLLSVPVSQN